MTANLFDALLRDVSRFDAFDGDFKQSEQGSWVTHASVLAALAAAVPADLAEAGKVADAADIYQFWVGDNLVNLGQTIRSLLARLAAQEARIGATETALQIEQRTRLKVEAQRDAAETALAAEQAKTAKLVEALNQYQLAAAGYVSVRSAKDKADAVLSAIAEAGQ